MLLVHEAALVFFSLSSFYNLSNRNKKSIMFLNNEHIFLLKTLRNSLVVDEK